MTLGLPVRPSLRRHYAVHIEPGEGVLLLAGSERRLLRGALYERLLPLLTGERSTDDLVDSLMPEFPPEEVYYALLGLVRTGALREAGEAGSPEATAYWDAAGARPDGAAARLCEHSLTVRRVGLLPGIDEAAAFAAAGLTIAPDGLWDVVLVDDYLNPELEGQNRLAMETGRPWVICKPVGREVWVGPLFVPGETSCWTCLTQRLRQNRPVEAYLGPGLVQASISLRASVGLALGWLGCALATAVATGHSEPLRDNLQTHDTITGRWRRHAVRRRPQCDSCGAPDLYTALASRPPVLTRRDKRLGDDSDQRCVALAATYRDFRKQIGPVTGIVTGLTRHHARESKRVQAYSAGPNVGLRYHGLDGLRTTLASTSAGKGATALKAKVSALGEALERYSGVHQGDEPRVRARLADLPGAIHPNRCMHFSERQYAERDALNGSGWAGDRIPPRFDPDHAAEWTAVWSLASGQKSYLPTMLLYYDYPARPGDRPCIATTNGAAAGNCFEEAVLHGLLELVERDCVSIWWYNRIPRPAVDLRTLRDRYVGRMLREYETIGREWWLLDLTNDLDIPCYAAVSRRISSGPEELLFGFGAHLDPRIAARRALTEMNQVVVARDSANTPFDSEPRLVRWLAEATLVNNEYLAPAGTTPARPSSATADLLDDLDVCRARLAAAGLDPLVLNQTRPDVGVAVAKVVVPELRYFRRRLAPGRLYDVPVTLGWLPRPHLESELNPEGFLL
ncbi:MAG: TOMM precursor leader peptide-binding protein [Gemmatimonadota bacterium]